MRLRVARKVICGPKEYRRTTTLAACRRIRVKTRRLLWLANSVKMSMEELRMDLGETFPRVIAATARRLGVQPAEFLVLVKKRQIMRRHLAFGER